VSTQHTQGQWAAVPAADGSGQFGIVADGKFVIAEFFPDIRTPLERADDECKGNAMRAAAAPDLLAAAILVEPFISGFDDDNLQDGVREMLRDLRAAIAKATGTPLTAQQLIDSHRTGDGALSSDAMAVGSTS